MRFEAKFLAMKKPFSILLPIDYRSENEFSVKYAFNLALALPAELIFFHVYGMPRPDASNPLEYAVDLSKKYNLEYEKLGRFVTEILDVHGHKESDFHIRMEVAEGNVKEQTLIFSTVEKADLIVLNAHEPREIKEYVFGTHTKAIVSESLTPVLCIPENTTYKPWKKILFATNLRHTELKSLEYLVNVASRNDATLYALHIETSDEDKWETMAEFDTYKQELVNSIDYKKFEIDILYDRDDVAEGLMEYAHGKDIDIIAIHPLKPSLTELIFGRHVGKELIYHSDIPILSVRKI